MVRLIHLLALLAVLLLTACGGQPVSNESIQVDLYYRLTIRIERAGYDRLEITDLGRLDKDVIQVEVRDGKIQSTRNITQTGSVAPFVYINPFEGKLYAPGDATITYLYPVGVDKDRPTTYIDQKNSVVVDTYLTEPLTSGADAVIHLAYTVKEDHHQADVLVKAGSTVDLSQDGRYHVLDGLGIEHEGDRVVLILLNDWTYQPDRG